jgi:hypothetical protein
MRCATVVADEEEASIRFGARPFRVRRMKRKLQSGAEKENFRSSAVL